MTLPKISVIIPAYNTEKYLNESINAVLNQTYPNIEIVIVNDGSTDGSDKLIESYASKYDNIVYVNNSNLVFSVIAEK